MHWIPILYYISDILYIIIFFISTKKKYIDEIPEMLKYTQLYDYYSRLFGLYLIGYMVIPKFKKRY